VSEEAVAQDGLPCTPQFYGGWFKDDHPKPGWITRMDTLLSQVTGILSALFSLAGLAILSRGAFIFGKWRGAFDAETKRIDGDLHQYHENNFKALQSIQVELREHRVEWRANVSELHKRIDAQERYSESERKAIRAEFNAVLRELTKELAAIKRNGT